MLSSGVSRVNGVSGVSGVNGVSEVSGWCPSRSVRWTRITSPMCVYRLSRSFGVYEVTIISYYVGLLARLDSFTICRRISFRSLHCSQSSVTRHPTPKPLRRPTANVSRPSLQPKGRAEAHHGGSMYTHFKQIQTNTKVSSAAWIG